MTESQTQEIDLPTDIIAYIHAVMPEGHPSTPEDDVRADDELVGVLTDPFLRNAYLIVQILGNALDEDAKVRVRIRTRRFLERRLGEIFPQAAKKVILGKTAWRLRKDWQVVITPAPLPSVRVC